jgi:hypothetical protein
MFFTKAGMVISWLLFVPSMFAYVMFQVAVFSGNVSELGDFLLGAAKSAPLGIMVGVGFGIASEISKTLASKA